MKNRNLGNIGLLVSESALRTIVFGEHSQRSSTTTEQVKPIIDQFLDAGGNLIDTANGYAGGRSEELVSAAIQLSAEDNTTLAEISNPENPFPNGFLKIYGNRG